MFTERESPRQKMIGFMAWHLKHQIWAVLASRGRAHREKYGGFVGIRTVNASSLFATDASLLIDVEQLIAINLPYHLHGSHVRCEARRGSDHKTEILTRVTFFQKKTLLDASSPDKWVHVVAGNMVQVLDKCRDRKSAGSRKVTGALPPLRMTEEFALRVCAAIQKKARFQNLKAVRVNLIPSLEFETGADVERAV